MNEIIKEIEDRKSKRALSEKPVPEEVVKRLLSAGTYAPSCFNNQPWRFVAVEGEEVNHRIGEHLPGANYWVKRSPLIILVCTRRDLDCDLSDGREYALFDAGLAAENIILQAQREGLIAHPIAGFKPVPIKETVGIPEDFTLITLIVLGYPGEMDVLNESHQASETAPRDRKPLEEVVFRNRWGKAF
jgi:nitroreductase